MHYGAVTEDEEGRWVSFFCRACGEDTQQGREGRGGQAVLPGQHRGARGLQVEALLRLLLQPLHALARDEGAERPLAQVIRFVAALADEVFLAHAIMGGHLEILSHRLRVWGIPLINPSNPLNAPNRPMPESHQNTGTVEDDS